MATGLEPTEQGSVELDGHAIHWERFGKGQREAVLLLNGLAMHTRAWYGFVPLLHPEYDVLLYDYLGQGESAKPDEPYSIARLADAAVIVMNHLGIEKLHAMGISYGGFVALELARQHHERLRTLTLSGILLHPEELFEMYEAISLRFYGLGPEAFGLYTHYLYEKIFGEAFVRRVTREGLEPMRQRFEDRYRDQIHCLVRLTEAQDPHFAAVEARLPEYRAVTTPTLVMPGEQDRTIPLWQQKRLLEVFPNSRWLPIPQSGHTAHIEQPERFFGNLLAFLRAGSLDFAA